MIGVTRKYGWEYDERDRANIVMAQKYNLKLKDIPYDYELRWYKIEELSLRDQVWLSSKCNR